MPPPDDRAPFLVARPGTQTVDEVAIVPMPAWKMVLVRTTRVYLQSLLAFLTAATTGFAGAIGVQMPVGDFWHLFRTSAAFAIAPAAMALLHNALELLARLDERKPSLRA